MKKNTNFKEPIKIIASIIEQFNKNYPNIFNALKKYEQTLLLNSKRHIFSIEDCKKVLLQIKDKNMHLDHIQLEIESECLLLVYNWSKTKIIFNIDKNIEQKDTIFINNSILKNMPYNAFYINTFFKNIDFLGVFVTITKEKQKNSLSTYLLLGFLKYNNTIKNYSIEPAPIVLLNNESVIKSTIISMGEFGYPIYSENKNTKSFLQTLSFLNEDVINIIYKIVESYNAYKPTKNVSLIKRKVSEINFQLSQNNDYNITNINKYKYLPKDQVFSNSSKKSPHFVRSHIRTYKYYDEYGNVIDEKTVKIKSYHTGKESDGIKPTIKQINNLT